jgi:hypothetical protein
VEQFKMSSNKEIQTKDQFLQEFSELRPDLYFPEEWGQKEKDVAIHQMRSSRTKASMFSSIPLKCRAAECIFADDCELQQQGIAPVGHKCPIELSTIKTLAEEYMVELGVDPTNLVEVSMIRDIVDQEIQYARKSAILAKEDLIQETVVGISPNGEVLTSKQLNLAVNLEDKIHKRKKDLRNSLMATREARARAGQGVLDTAQQLANVFEQVREVELKHERILREKLGKTTEDEYIIEAKLKSDESED